VSKKLWIASLFVNQFFLVVVVAVRLSVCSFVRSLSGSQACSVFVRFDTVGNMVRVQSLAVSGNTVCGLTPQIDSICLIVSWDFFQYYQ